MMKGEFAVAVDDSEKEVEVQLSVAGVVGK